MLASYLGASSFGTYLSSVVYTGSGLYERDGRVSKCANMYCEDFEPHIGKS